MRSAHKSLTSLSILAMIAAAPAVADVTPAEIWADWQKQLTIAATSEGGSLSIGSETNDGDTLVVKDVALRVTSEEGGEPLVTTLTFPELRFEPQSGGRVRVDLPDLSPLHIDSGRDKIVLDLFSEGDEIIASGDKTTRDYALKIAGYGLRISPASQLTSGGNLNGELRISDLSGQYTTKSTDSVEELSVSANAPSLTYNLGGTDGTGFSFSLKGQSEGLTTQAQTSYPVNASEEDLLKGLIAEANYTLGASQFSMTSKDNGEVFGANGSAATSAMALSMRDGSLGYTLSANQLAIALSPEMGGLGGEVESITSTSQVPYLPNTNAQPFQFGLNIAGLKIADAVWGMFDPQNTLPRDPAVINIALSGDVVIPAEGEPSPQRLSLDALNLSALGARIAGTGAFTVGDMTQFYQTMEIPPVDGKASFTFDGLQGLAQKLSALGLIGSEEAMGVNMMLGMFGKSTGADAYSTEISVTGGKLIVNGMPIN